MTSYGTPDSDPAPLAALMIAVEGREVEYVIHFPRVAIDARPCLLPLSLKVSAVLANKQVVTAFQAAPGRRIEITTT